MILSSIETILIRNAFIDVSPEKKRGYDDLHCTYSFLTIDSLLLMELICGYKMSIVCKNNFEIIYLAPAWNASLKKAK